MVQSHDSKTAASGTAGKGLLEIVECAGEHPYPYGPQEWATLLDYPLRFRSITVDFFVGAVGLYIRRFLWGNPGVHYRVSLRADPADSIRRILSIWRAGNGWKGTNVT